MPSVHSVTWDLVISLHEDIIQSSPLSPLISNIILAFVSFGFCRLLWSVFTRKGKLSTTIPEVEGGVPFLGQVFNMVKGSPWDLMTTWTQMYGSILRFKLFGKDAVVVADPDLLKIILSTKLR